MSHQNEIVIMCVSRRKTFGGRSEKMLIGDGKTFRITFFTCGLLNLILNLQFGYDFFIAGSQGWAG